MSLATSWNTLASKTPPPRTHVTLTFSPQVSHVTVMCHIAMAERMLRPVSTRDLHTRELKSCIRAVKRVQSMKPPLPLLSLAGLVMMALTNMMLHSHGFLLGQKIGMMTRIICTGAIYQKVGCVWGIVLTLYRNDLYTPVPKDTAGFRNLKRPMPWHLNRAASPDSWMPLRSF